MDPLQQGLRDYHTALTRHFATLGVELQQVESAWDALDPVYQGEAAESFRQSWLKTLEFFRRYLDDGARLEREFDRRLRALETSGQPLEG